MQMVILIPVCSILFRTLCAAIFTVMIYPQVFNLLASNASSHHFEEEFATRDVDA